MSRKDDPCLAKLTPQPTPPGPRAKTPYGTVVDVLRYAGCGLLHVNKANDKEKTTYVVHISSLTGITPKHEEALAAMRRIP